MIKLTDWYATYMKCLFILSQSYTNSFKTPDPDGFFATREDLKQSIKCFINSLFKILPDAYIKEKCLGFYYMNSQVITILMSEKKIVLYLEINRHIKNKIEETRQLNYINTNFLDFCLQNDLLFDWLYLLQIYIYTLLNKQGHTINIPSYNEIKEIYKMDHISKDDWGNSTWFILHTLPLYGDAISVQDLFYNYKAMLSCLQYLLPCPKCRSHLRNNLTRLDIDYCISGRDKLFEFSWKLHNIVNQDLNKYQPTLKEAQLYYQF